ncbi:MAG: hypothetical protein ACYS22_12180 [Planctomycetota bacterium]
MAASPSTPGEVGQASAAETPNLEVEPVFLRETALRLFSDRLTLRDPSGRSARPNLGLGRAGDEVGIFARGPFNLHQRYTVTKEQGTVFCEVTGDPNPIHTEGEVVPGAYSAAKLLLALEVVFPFLSLKRAIMKFTAIGTYGRSVFTQVRYEPAPNGAVFRATISQEGEQIAQMEVEAVAGIPAPAPVPRRRIHVEQVHAVRAFCRSLGIEPRAYFWEVEPGATRRDGGRYFYPRAFLSALPSGEMVKQLRGGGGGLLNKLTLDFDPSIRIPITRDAAPLVELEGPKRRRSTFNRILTAIKNGFGTAVRGTALVLTGEAARRIESGERMADPEPAPTKQDPPAAAFEASEAPVLPAEG